MMKMKSKSDKFSVYLIGRGSDVHIHIDDTSVSRIHAELVVTKGGDLFLTDRASSGGTFVARNGTWHRITQDFVKTSDSILVGRYQTTVGKILNGINQGTVKRSDRATQSNHNEDEQPLGPVRRNPETGEVVSDN